MTSWPPCLFTVHCEVFTWLLFSLTWRWCIMLVPVLPLRDLPELAVTASCLAWCMQVLLSRQVESGQEQSRLPVSLAVLCFSRSWDTMASTVSVVLSNKNSLKYLYLLDLTEISSSLFKSGSSSLKTGKKYFYLTFSLTQFINWKLEMFLKYIK